jgi:6-phosphogluconolactonase (cycloisomerase 2 family)
MLRISRWVSVFVIVLGVVNVSADDPSEGGRLKLVESLPRDEIDSVVKAVVSPDGKFLYASSWKLSSVLAFARDPETGKLELKQTIIDADNLDCVTGLALSLDGNLAIATAFRSRTAVLYLRNHQG